LSTTTLKRNAPCPCGSELLAKDCCYPTKPPVNLPVPQYVQEHKVPVITTVRSPSGIVPKWIANHIASALTQITNITLEYRHESGPGILPREQANQQIARVLGYGLNDYHLDKVRNEHILIGPLHSVKYHQQQCMYRLYLLQQRSNKFKHTPSTNVSDAEHASIVQAIQFEDTIKS
jgi:hypothetical protein